MKATTTLLTLGLISAVSLYAVTAYAKGMSAQDFVTKASIANEFEIESSKVALTKSNDSEVKHFAQQMVDDHGKTGEKLEQTLADSHSDAKPADKLDVKHQKLLDTLQNSSASNFDSKYIAMQTDAHKEAVKLFASYSEQGKDGALKDFATKTLPTLKMHLTHVKQLSH